MTFGDYLLEQLKTICPADRVGTGHDTETPYILLSYSDSPYKFGFKASVTFYVIDFNEALTNSKFNQVQNIFTGRFLGEYVIRKVEYTKPIISKLPDDRWMQEVSVLITFEEV